MEASATRSAAWIDREGKLATEGISVRVPWWSFTKTTLSIAALSLVEQGRLPLFEPLAGRTYSLAHLLRHEAGLPDYGGVARYHEDVAAGKAPWPVTRLLRAVEADRLRYAPGTGWAYSNIGYLQVGQLVATATGLSLAEALDRLVFQPAGVTSARLATTPEQLVGVEMAATRGYHPGWVYHGLVTGTTADAARLLHALFAGAILQSSTVEEMLQGRSLPEHRSARDPDPAYGLGLMMWATDPHRHPAGHSGAGPGSKIAVYHRAGETAAIWAASGSGSDPTAEVFGHLERGA